MAALESSSGTNYFTPQESHAPLSWKADRSYQSIASTREHRSENAELVRQAISHLEANYTEPVTLRELEAVTEANIFKIIRAFRNHLDTTPHAYLMGLRVSRAEALLREGETIVGAAAEAGFTDQSHFTKHFKKAFGITPGAFVRLMA